MSEPTETRGGRSKRIFVLTASGKRALYIAARGRPRPPAEPSGCPRRRRPSGGRRCRRRGSGPASARLRGPRSPAPAAPAARSSAVRRQLAGDSTRRRRGTRRSRRAPCASRGLLGAADADRPGDDERASAGAAPHPLQQPRFLEVGQRGSQRHLRHSQLHRELALGRQLVAGQEAAELDRPRRLRDDDLGGGGDRDRPRACARDRLIPTSLSAPAGRAPARRSSARRPATTAAATG